MTTCPYVPLSDSSVPDQPHFLRVLLREEATIRMTQHVIISFVVLRFVAAEWAGYRYLIFHIIFQFDGAA
jgi:hypothetical protein